MDTPLALVERDEALGDLHAALARVRDGHGEVALVTGEAGAGKTSVIREFLRQAAGPPMVLRGACDPLTTPRPLGPLIDAAGDVDRVVAQRLVAGVSRAEAFATALSLIDGSRSGGRAVIFVVEDAHWADDATLDLLTFLARRIGELPTLMVISFRDDEVGMQHPLRARLGEAASSIRCRVRLPGLSPDGVAELVAGLDVGLEFGTTADIDPLALHRMTGGNAFFVTEVLAGGAGTLPESVRDAVLARAARLPALARSVLDAASVEPGRVEQWLLDAVASDVDAASGVEICVEHGLLRSDAGGTVTFRHELARLAMLDAVPAARRRVFHRRALAALVEPPTGQIDASRIAFHASEADDVDALVAFGPAAATAAASVGAHGDAALHLERVLRHRGRIEAATRAPLLVRLGDELMVTADVTGSLQAYDDANELYAELGDVEGQAVAQVKSARPLSNLGRQHDVDARIERATAMVRGRAASHASALVSSSSTTSYMLARQFEAAEREGQHAMALAEAIGDDLVLAEACIQSGIALAMSGDDRGLERIRRGIALARGIGDDRLVSTGFMQIGSGYGELRRYDVAMAALQEGIVFASDREIFEAEHYMNAWLARCHLELGQWDDAARITSTLLRNPRCTGRSRFVALVTLAWVRGRRGDPDVAPLLDEALDFARGSGHLQRLWPVAACRAEMAWLRDRIGAEQRLLDETMTLAGALEYVPAVEDLARWCQLAVGDATGFTDAGGWTALGCPYETAMVEFFTGTPESLTSAMRTFDRLGAAPMRARTIAALRAVGSPVPRGPSAGTRDNPHSLTQREIDVLGLVATGRTDREIAAVLHISVKTVGHHVSHVLAKLEVRSRSEAAVAAERLGLTATS